MLSDGLGGYIHTTPAVEGWLTPGHDPFGLYPYRSDVDGLAADFKGETLEKDGPNDKPWEMANTCHSRMLRSTVSIFSIGKPVKKTRRSLSCCTVFRLHHTSIAI